MNINSILIEQLSAEAFWNFVHKYSMRETGFPTTIDMIPKVMWSREMAKKKVTQLGYNDEDLIDSIYKLVGETIAEHCTLEKNIIGTIYIEDFKECKEKDFSYTNLIVQSERDADQNCDYNVNITGNLPNTGTLLLRTPLPSVVLLKEDPVKLGYRALIPDTNTALGFTKTMILIPQGTTVLPDNPYGYGFAVTGIFFIPTQSPHDSVWYKLIPNSTGVLSGINLDYNTHVRISAKYNLFQRLNNFFNRLF